MWGVKMVYCYSCFALHTYGPPTQVALADQTSLKVCVGAPGCSLSLHPCTVAQIKLNFCCVGSILGVRYIHINGCRHFTSQLPLSLWRKMTELKELQSNLKQWEMWQNATFIFTSFINFRKVTDSSLFHKDVTFRKIGFLTVFLTK